MVDPSALFARGWMTWSNLTKRTRFGFIFCVRRTFAESNGWEAKNLFRRRLCSSVSMKIKSDRSLTSEQLLARAPVARISADTKNPGDPRECGIAASVAKKNRIGRAAVGERATCKLIFRGRPRNIWFRSS